MKLFRLKWWPKIVRPDNSMDDYWDSMIHPNDLSIMETGEFYGDVFSLVSENEDYLKITDGTNVIRVNQMRRKDCLTPIPFEGFFLGDSVQVKSLNGKNTVRSGSVCYMFYHYKDDRIVYHIKDETGKQLKKRYYSDDLLKAN